MKKFMIYLSILMISNIYAQCDDYSLSECNNDNSCEWVENLEIENCYDILDCNPSCNWQDCEAIEGCIWHFGTSYYDPSYCYGEHEVDNSYCEDIQYELGDVNHDSIIDILDIISIVNIIFENEYNYLADINSDSIINVLDIIAIVNRILN